MSPPSRFISNFNSKLYDYLTKPCIFCKDKLQSAYLSLLSPGWAMWMSWGRLLAARMQADFSRRQHGKKWRFWRSQTIVQLHSFGRVLRQIYDKLSMVAFVNCGTYRSHNTIIAVLNHLLRRPIDSMGLNHIFHTLLSKRARPMEYMGRVSKRFRTQPIAQRQPLNARAKRTRWH